MIDSTLKALLIHAKKVDDTDDTEYELSRTWIGVSKSLEELYNYDMKLVDVVHIMLSAYIRLTKDDRYGVRLDIADLVLSNTKSDDFMNPLRLDSTKTIEEYYNVIVSHILFKFRFANVYWCRDELSELFEKDLTIN